MKRIVLFRFHKNVAVCQNRLSQLKKFNPDIAVYGLYGGSEDDPEGIQAALKSEFVSIYSLSGKSDEWKWEHSDLAVREWYSAIGKMLDFDMLHLLEWDLLLCDSLDKIYKNIPNGVGLTGLVPLEAVQDGWSWTNKEPEKGEWEQLLSLAKEKFGYHDKPLASLGPGTCYSKSFLDNYSAIDVPEICHDELRLPLFTQILGVPIYDTGFVRKWFDAEDRMYFNCRNEDIQLETIQKELANPHGRRVFHPVRCTVNL